MRVSKTQRFGREVYLSRRAEKGRKFGCLCVHEEKSGEKVYCRRLLNNIATQRQFAENAGERSAQSYLRVMAAKALSLMMNGADPFKELGNTDPCPVALVFFEVCKAGGVACGVSFCPGYLAPEKKR